MELIKQDVWIVDSSDAGKIEKGNFTLGSLIEFKQVYVLTEDELRKIIIDAVFTHKEHNIDSFIQSITKNEHNNSNSRT